MGFLFGVIIELARVKSIKIKTILLAAFASIAGIGLAIPAYYYRYSLGAIYFFNDFHYDLTSLPLFNSFGYNAEFASAVTLIALLEVSLVVGFSAAYRIGAVRKKSNKPVAPADDSTKKSANGTKPKLGTTDTTTSAEIPAYSTEQESLEFVDEPGLKKDEQAMMELFLYGKVTQINPIVDATKPDGYYFDGVPQLDWETKRSRQALDSLVRKGMLKAELVDKVIVCMSCGSANVRIKKLCPECMSLRLRKEALIEHFSCGAVERQVAFESPNGDLVCPKCKNKLQLIGSDYRVLPPAYVCLGCNNRSSEPLLVMKCDDCAATAQIDEEPELFLYKYTADSKLSNSELQQIKPIEVCTNFFKSLGYTFVAPAFVSGRSGTQHLFDILVLGRVGWVEPQTSATSTPMVKKDNGNTVIQVLISSKLIDLEEMTRIYGMINDIDCDSLIFVIPGVTESARNYASAYSIKLSEGKTIEEALANSKIPKLPKATFEKA